MICVSTNVVCQRFTTKNAYFNIYGGDMVWFQIFSYIKNVKLEMLASFSEMPPPATYVSLRHKLQKKIVEPDKSLGAAPKKEPVEPMKAPPDAPILSQRAKALNMCQSVVNNCLMNMFLVSDSIFLQNVLDIFLMIFATFVAQI